MMLESPLLKTRTEQVIDALGRAIVSGEIEPGTPLPPEKSLLEQYGVSRTVLREALQVLSAKGLVDSRQKRGTRVAMPDRWNHLDPIVLGWHGQLSARTPILRDLIELRRLLEPTAAALAASRKTPEDDARLASAYERMEKAADQGDTGDFIAADLEFHSAILRATHNRMLLPLAYAIRATLLVSLRVTNSRALENYDISLPLHKAILDAILARDGLRASQAMSLHLDDTELALNDTRRHV